MLQKHVGGNKVERTILERQHLYVGPHPCANRSMPDKGCMIVVEPDNQRHRLNKVLLLRSSPRWEDLVPAPDVQPARSSIQQVRESCFVDFVGVLESGYYKISSLPVPFVAAVTKADSPRCRSGSCHCLLGLHRLASPALLTSISRSLALSTHRANFAARQARYHAKDLGRAHKRLHQRRLLSDARTSFGGSRRLTAHALRLCRAPALLFPWHSAGFRHSGQLLGNAPVEREGIPGQRQAVPARIPDLPGGEIDSEGGSFAGTAGCEPAFEVALRSRRAVHFRAAVRGSAANGQSVRRTMVGERAARRSAADDDCGGSVGRLGDRPQTSKVRRVLRGLPRRTMRQLHLVHAGAPPDRGSSAPRRSSERRVLALQRLHGADASEPWALFTPSGTRRQRAFRCRGAAGLDRRGTWQSREHPRDLARGLCGSRARRSGVGPSGRRNGTAPHRLEREMGKTSAPVR